MRQILAPAAVYRSFGAGDLKRVDLFNFLLASTVNEVEI
jgi:hypothetical protein